MSDDLRQVVSPVLPIWREHVCGNRVRELLFGELFLVKTELDGVGYGRSKKDGCRGYVDLGGLGELSEATHVVCSRATHIFPKPDIKSSPPTGLSFGSRLTVTGSDGAFLAVGGGGFVWANQLRPIAKIMGDPAGVAETFLGAPYLWGGNSCWGIDCSGLVQSALLACGKSCPGDSGEQQKAVGEPFGDNLPVERGDLLFWNGHVAIALDDQNLIHATAFHMAVVVEDIQQVNERIAEQGVGPVLARRRP